MLLNCFGMLFGRVLATLVRIEYFGCAISGDSLLQDIACQREIHRIGELPCQQGFGVSIDNGGKIHEGSFDRDIGDFTTANLLGFFYDDLSFIVLANSRSWNDSSSAIGIVSLCGVYRAWSQQEFSCLIGTITPQREVIVEAGSSSSRSSNTTLLSS